MILVDTHVVLWMAFEPHRLTANAREAIDRSRANGTGLALSSMSLWELALLASKQRITLRTSAESFLREVEARFEVVQMNSVICLRAAAFPPDFPRDPVDRVIAATAIVRGLPLLTADPEIQQSKDVNTIW